MPPGVSSFTDGVSALATGARLVFVIVHVKTSVSVSPPVSVTVSVTEYGEDAFASNVTVPVIAPVPVSIERPSGSPDAA